MIPDDLSTRSVFLRRCTVYGCINYAILSSFLHLVQIENTRKGILLPIFLLKWFGTTQFVNHFKGTRSIEKQSFLQ